MNCIMMASTVLRYLPRTMMKRNGNFLRHMPKKESSLSAAAVIFMEAISLIPYGGVWYAGRGATFAGAVIAAAVYL